MIVHRWWSKWNLAYNYCSRQLTISLTKQPNNDPWSQWYMSIYRAAKKDDYPKWSFSFILFTMYSVFVVDIDDKCCDWDQNDCYSPPHNPRPSACQFNECGERETHQRRKESLFGKKQGQVMNEASSFYHEFLPSKFKFLNEERTLAEGRCESQIFILLWIEWLYST